MLPGATDNNDYRRRYLRFVALAAQKSYSRRLLGAATEQGAMMGKGKGGRDEFAAQAAKGEAEQVAGAATQVIAPVVAGAGLYLEEVKLVGAGSQRALRVTIDLPQTETGSLDSDRLGAVSRAISAALDTDDVVPGAYNLEVSTPGATRPLTELRHFRRAQGRVVALELRDGSTISGRITVVSPSLDQTQ
ncbi:MAG: ribosome maturation factor RimP, partial [Cellulomonadaceae bacterium]|nr:ribosome maturation factor RimP [Cellulomonadaceae bacterium]